MTARQLSRRRAIRRASAAVGALFLLVILLAPAIADRITQ